MGAQRSRATLKCTTTGSAFSISIPYFMVSNRDRELVWAAVDYIEDVIWVTPRCHRDSIKRCHAKWALDEAASSAYGTAALDPLLPEMMKMWGLDFGMDIRDEWRRGEPWANREKATRTGCGINCIRGTFSPKQRLQPCGCLPRGKSSFSLVWEIKY